MCTFSENRLEYGLPAYCSLGCPRNEPTPHKCMFSCFNPGCGSGPKFARRSIAEAIFRTCSTCRAVRYCDKRCEAQDRQDHAMECVPFSANGTASAVERR